jgi:hypothetical protein
MQRRDTCFTRLMTSLWLMPAKLAQFFVSWSNPAFVAMV